MENKKIIGLYDYTVILTYLGLIFAFTGIINVLNQNYVLSILFLMLSGVCDMFDGTVASTKKRNACEKHFGIEIDSLCDLISFGLFPSLFVFIISGKSLLAGIVGAFYVLCAVIRLAFYNVQEIDRQKLTDEKRECFLGIPVTSIAIILPCVFFVNKMFGIEKTSSYLIILFLLAIGFICRITIKKPKLIGKIILLIIGMFEIIGIYLLLGKFWV